MFIVFTVIIITTLVYFLYQLMLNAQQDKKDELQITSEELLAQIKILHKQKKNNIVESLAKSYLAKKTTDDEVRIVLAKALYDMNKIYEAIEQAKIVVKHQPKNNDVKIFIANCYLGIQNPIAAAELLQEVLGQDPANVVAVKELAQIYFDTNQKKSAIKMYKKFEDLLESDFERSKIKVKIAEIHVEFMDYHKAIKEYEEILEIYPEELSVKKRLIDLYKMSNDYDSAIELADKVVRTLSFDSEDSLWILQKLMEIYNKIKNFQKALEVAKLIKEHPLSDDVQSGQDVAAILLSEGQVDSSVELLEELIDNNPENIELKKDLAKAYVYKKDFDMALGVYKKLLDMVNPSEIEDLNFEISNIYSDWAMYLFFNDNNDDCFKKFGTALKYNAQNPDIYYRLGNVNTAVKNYNEAISQYKKALELNPKNAAYYIAMAQCYEEIDSIYEQKKALLESLKYDDKNPKVHFKLGLVFALQNDPNSAFNYVKQAVDLDEDYIEAKHKLALMYEHKGNTEEAIALYEDILRLTPENEDIANNLKMLKS